ncbi:hypothetical protein PABG_11649 [Paracoccidioides brasiliensis Pb03]|nr:hypothetical protein PABG_11649 [Paracoccidioides brasiliensis Pb03]
MVRSRMRAGEITGFEQVAHPYNLRYAGDKAFNNSGERGYGRISRTSCSSTKIFTPLSNIIRQMLTLMRMALSGKQAHKHKESRPLNYRPVVSDRQDTVKKHKRELEYREAESERVNKVLEKLELFRHRTAETKAEYNRAIRELRNEKQRHRNRRIHENFERYKNEQPVIYLERQLAGKLVENKSHEHF